MAITTCPGCGATFEASDTFCPACHRCLICGARGLGGRRPSCEHALEETDSEDTAEEDRIPELLAQREQRLAEPEKSAVKKAIVVLVRGIALAWTGFLVLWNSTPPPQFDQREAILRTSAVALTGAIAVALVYSTEDRISIWSALAIVMVCVQVLPLFAWAFWLGA